MTRRNLIRASVVIASCACAVASAEMFKCRTPDGKTVFSDTRCEDAIQMDKPAASAPAEAAPGARYELTSADRERIRALDAVVDKPGSNSEQKTAAQLEISNIRRGAEETLTREQRKRREALTAELANGDPKKRAQTLGQLRTFYDR